MSDPFSWSVFVTFTLLTVTLPLTVTFPLTVTLLSCSTLSYRVKISKMSWQYVVDNMSNTERKNYNHVIFFYLS